MTPIEYKELRALTAQRDGTSRGWPMRMALTKALDYIVELKKMIDTLEVEVASHNESPDLFLCRCMGCNWKGLASPPELCPECSDCLEIR